VSGESKAVTNLTEQIYGVHPMRRGLTGKTFALLRTFRYNPRGTILRAAKSSFKLFICSYVFKTYFETLYKMRQDPPWERYYREQAAHPK